MAIPRLMVDQSLRAGSTLPLTPEQARYLRAVMRLDAGATVRVFNGRDGEWRARLLVEGKRDAALAPEERLREQQSGPDLHLVFAPLKKTRTDFVVEKATELGAAALRPVFTRRTNAERVNVERLRALAREAAEQSERLDAPSIAAPEPLEALLDAWPSREADRRLVFCDEAAAGDTSWGAADAAATPPALAAFAAAAPGTPAAILIGPEGGFAAEERARLRSAPFATAVSLGPRILRADTAAAAALTLWMAALGDWR